MTHWLEISDLIVDYDHEDLSRHPVRRDEVVRQLTERGQRWGARVARRLPVDADGVLDPTEVDRVLLHCHAEIQRLSEESGQGHRIWTLLSPLLDVLRARGVSPVRVVDVGCGVGFAIRWLARHHAAPDVEYVGVDYNRALVRAARELARREALPCAFLVDNAFALDAPGHIYLSNGVLHHFHGEGLRAFFAQQREAGAAAFAHFDIQPSWASPIGAMLFHFARFQEPLARHDGFFSAVRAHPGRELLEAARDPGGEFAALLFDNQERLLPIFRIMHAAVGLRRELVPALREALGADAHRLTGATP